MKIPEQCGSCGGFCGKGPCQQERINWEEMWLNNALIALHEFQRIVDVKQKEEVWRIIEQIKNLRRNKDA